MALPSGCANAQELAGGRSAALAVSALAVSALAEAALAEAALAGSVLLGSGGGR
jgi:hypothetical protein